MTAGQARGYLAKAEEFTDAVCGVRLGKRAAGQNHDQVVPLVNRVGKDGVEVGQSLRRLLPLKTTAEYDPDSIPRSKAARAVEQAVRCVMVARRVVASQQ